MSILGNKREIFKKNCELARAKFISYCLEKASIIELLFQNQNTILVNADQKLKIIMLLEFLITQFIEAFAALNRTEYNKFDAQVGENICQARASFLLDYAAFISPVLREEEKNIDQKLECILEVLKNIKESLNQDNYSQDITKRSIHKKPIKLDDFIYSINANIYLPKIFLILMRCYFLRKYCILDELGIPNRMDFLRVQKSAGLSKHFAKRTIHHFQVEVANFSIFYTRYLSFNVAADLEMSALLNLTIRFSDEDRKVAPCYDGMQLFLGNMIKNNYPLVFVASFFVDDDKETVTLLFLPDQTTNNFRLASVDECVEYKNKMCMVLEGDSSSAQPYRSMRAYVEKILALGIYKILMLNMAKHPQYTGKKLGKFRDEPYLDIVRCDYVAVDENIGNIRKYAVQRADMLKRMQRFAVTYGCCRENASLYLVKHIFCDKILNYCAYNKLIYQYNYKKYIQLVN